MCTTETREQKATTPAQRVAWGKIAKADKVVFTGDMNAHSKMWIWKTTRPSNNVSWERLVEDNDLVIWNTQEETKMGEEVERHSFNDPTQASPGAELAWRICRDQATVSNYKLIRWEVLPPPPPPHQGMDMCMATTRWDISGWDPEGKEGEKREAAVGKSAQAQECFQRGCRDSPTLDSDSAQDEVDRAAAMLREAMVGTVDDHARLKRWCSRSKR